MKHNSHNNSENLNPDSSAAKQTKKRFFTKGRIIALSITAVIIGLCVWDIADPPLWWQFQAQKNKRAAIEYVNVHYPGAKLIRGVYKSTDLDPWTFDIDSFYFELNDINFGIVVEKGSVSADFYWTAFAKQQVYISYLEPFFEMRNITSGFVVSSSDLASFFEENPNADISQFQGEICILMKPNVDDTYDTPESFGWLYDFYCYCRGNITNRYFINITCKNSSINFNNEMVYNNEKEFYAAFSAG